MDDETIKDESTANELTRRDILGAVQSGRFHPRSWA
jgi:hypothetical protein